MLQADLLTGFDQVVAAHTAKLRIVQDEVGELGALLYQVDLRQSPDLVMEALYADQFGKHDSRIIETERLVKIAGQKILLHHEVGYPFLVRPFLELGRRSAPG